MPTTKNHDNPNNTFPNTPMNFPLTVRFKFLAITPQFFVDDAAGQPQCYVKQKFFKLRENIEVFRDETRQELLCTIAADRIIDWSAHYHFTAPNGMPLGSVGRKGMRSIWRTHYDITKPGEVQSDIEIREENPWAKIGDGILSDIPVLGLFSGYFFHPRYIFRRRSTGELLMRVTKQAAFLEGLFLIEKLSNSNDQETMTIVLSAMMMLLLERSRG
jgi:hypothetical protein